MMREILFRGKRIDNGEWVEGGIAFEDYTDKAYIVRRNTFGLGYFEYIEVDTNTISQSTGLCDKNGKKIFEGDKVEIRGYVYYCCWDAVNLEFMLINKKESFGMGYAASSRMTVIGNVHDKPELLEVDDET